MAYSKIIDSISTAYEVRQLHEAITELQAALYKTDDGVFDQTFRRLVPVHVADNLRKAVPQEREDAAAYLRELDEQLQQLPVVGVDLAFHPTEGFLDELVGKLREVMEVDVVVDARVSRLLLGGARVEYQGRFKDYSVRQQLSALLDQQQDRIGSMSDE